MTSDSSKKRLEASKRKAAESLHKLDWALRWLDAGSAAEDREGRFDAVAKRFEVAFEYVWKAFKSALDAQGIESYGPKDSIASAARFGWIENVERWIVYLETRNAGVHDYFGVDEHEYIEIARSFVVAARDSLQRVE